MLQLEAQCLHKLQATVSPGCNSQGRLLCAGAGFLVFCRQQVAAGNGSTPSSPSDAQEVCLRRRTNVQRAGRGSALGVAGLPQWQLLALAR